MMQATTGNGGVLELSFWSGLNGVMVFLFKAWRRVYRDCSVVVTTTIARMLLWLNGAVYQDVKSYGLPLVRVSRHGVLMIGRKFVMQNGHRHNPIGRNMPCSLVVRKYGVLQIGDNVGISSCAINCCTNINIGNDVNIGGGVCIYDSDFHSLHAHHRKDRNMDYEHTKSAPVIIGDGVFIGSHSTILKGVQIGANAVIGACSVVTKNVPENEIWGGNPARRLRDC